MAQQQEERVIAGSRRPDGTLRKEVRIRAGFTPQDEQRAYVPAAVLVRAAGCTSGALQSLVAGL